MGSESRGKPGSTTLKATAATAGSSARPTPTAGDETATAPSPSANGRCILTQGPYSVWERPPPQTGYRIERAGQPLSDYPSLESAIAQVSYMMELDEGGTLGNLFTRARSALSGT